MRIRNIVLILLLISALPAVVLLYAMISQHPQPTGPNHWQVLVIPPAIYLIVALVGLIIRRRRSRR